MTILWGRLDFLKPLNQYILSDEIRVRFGAPASRRIDLLDPPQVRNLFDDAF